MVWQLRSAPPWRHSGEGGVETGVGAREKGSRQQVEFKNGGGGRSFLRNGERVLTSPATDVFARGYFESIVRLSSSQKT